MSISMFYVVRNKVSTNLEADFKFSAWDRFNSLEREMEGNMEVLRSVCALFDSNEFVTRNQFELFCKSALLNHKDIQALEWIQRVPGLQRENYEQKAQADGYPNYHITRRGTQGEMLRANESREYFPVYYLEPHIGNESDMGFDLATNQKRLEALSRSCDTRKMVATPRIKLVQEKGNQYGFLVFMPVYEKLASLDTVEERRENLKGFVLGVFRIGDLVETSVGYIERKGIDVHLFDVSNPHDEQFLYFHPSRLNHEVGQSLPQNALGHDELYISNILNVADRKWSVRCKAIPTFIEHAQTWYPRGFLVGGLVFTGLLAFYCYNLSGRAEILEQSVSERTANLKDSELRLNYALDAISDGIWDWNVISGEVRFSKHWCESLGYNHEEVEKHISFWKNIIHPDDKKRTIKCLYDHVHGKTKICEIENRLRLKSGAYRYNLDIGKVVEWDNVGNPIRVVGIDKDITERKKTEEKLCRLSHAIECSSATIIITDTKGNIEYSNPKFTQLTGYSHEEVVGKNPSILKSGKTSPCVYKELWGTITSGNEWKGEFCNRKKTGEFYWESVSISPVKNNKGFITNFIAVKDDITDYKYSERRLKAQHEVTKVLSESNTIREASTKIIQAICTALEWDLGEIWEFDQQKNVLFNSAIWHVQSLKVSEFKAVTKKITFSPKIGLPGHVFGSAEPFWIADIVHDTNFPRASIADKEGLHGAFGFPIIVGTEVLGSICFYSCEIKKPDNDLLNMISAIGRQIGLFFKRNQVEETLFQSEKLNSLGTITSGIAHEFNNILGVILGSAEVLEGGFEDDRELKRGLNDIIKACDDGSVIVKRMRTFSDMDVNPSDFILIDIEYIVKEAIRFTMPRWKNMAQASGIDFRIDTEGMEKTPEVFCNPTELREVFVNLINNAMDAMPDGGCVFFDTKSNENNVFVDVSDTGIGMDENIKKRIFEPFFSIRKPLGTGLGMSVTYSIIKKHGGNIMVDSEVGKGTTFKLSIPICKEAKQKAVPPELIPETTLKKLRILVIDDEERICVKLNELLSRCGHMVKTADNGAKAIELTRKGDFDLALCDLAMPGINGYDVIKAINKIDHRPKIGVITGWNEKIPLVDEENLGVDFVIRKPFNFLELTKQING